MANPSTTGPSGAGTEVLRRVFLKDHSNAWTTILNGEADHIYTILSVIFVNTTSAAINIALQVDPEGDSANNAGSQQYLKHYSTDPLPAYSTYVWNDKFVITGVDHLVVYSSSTCDMYVSFIDQEFA